MFIGENMKHHKPSLSFLPGELVCLGLCQDDEPRSYVGPYEPDGSLYSRERLLDRKQPLVYVRTYIWTKKYPEWNVEVLAGDQLMTVYGPDVIKFEMGV